LMERLEEIEEDLLHKQNRPQPPPNVVPLKNVIDLAAFRKNT
jgi:hypothetical protein